MPAPATAPTPQALPERVGRMLEERLFSGKLELPLLPDTSAQVVSLCNDESCDARQLAELLRRDQALTAHVLKVANSAAYAPKEPIVSLQQAVSRLGMGVICEIAVAVSLKGRVFAVPGWQVRIREMWMHAAATACYAKEVARLLRLNVEGAFLCGLLHDVGKPIVMQVLVDAAREETARDVPAPLMELAMHTFHERVGAMLVEAWNLPEWMSAVVGHHHHWDGAGEHREEVLVTNLADDLCHWALVEGSAEEDFQEGHPAAAGLNLYEDDVADLLGLRGRIVEVAEAFL